MAIDGGPAYPTNEQMPFDGVWPGMTLRDWFAGQVMASFAAKYGSELPFEEAAEDAYAAADAMLARRLSGVE